MQVNETLYSRQEQMPALRNTPTYKHMLLVIPPNSPIKVLLSSQSNYQHFSFHLSSSQNLTVKSQQLEK